MRFISLWVNTAFSTKYGSIFITASWMGSTTRCILLTGTKPQAPLRRALPPLHQPPETVKEQSAEEEWRFQVLARSFWVTDWLTGCAHLRCSVKKCRLFRCHSLSFPPPPPSSERLRVWVRVRLLPRGTYCSLHPLPQAHTTVLVSCVPRSVLSVSHSFTAYCNTHSHP